MQCRWQQEAACILHREVKTASLLQEEDTSVQRLLLPEQQKSLDDS